MLDNNDSLLPNSTLVTPTNSTLVTPNKIEESARPEENESSINLEENETPRTVARKRRKPVLEAIFKNEGGETPRKKKGHVSVKMVGIFTHVLAEQEGVDLRRGTPTKWFWQLMIDKFGLCKGQGFIGSTSPDYLCRVWRQNFTEGGRSGPHQEGVYCGTDFVKRVNNDQDGGHIHKRPPAPLPEYSCPVCGKERSTWNSLRSHIQLKHAGDAKTLIMGAKSQVGQCLI